MRLYLDDDMASALLARLLSQAGHDVQVPDDVGMSGANDPVHLGYAIREHRVLLSGNHDDFEAPHDLIMQAQGHHPGIVINYEAWISSQYNNMPFASTKGRLYPAQNSKRGSPVRPRMQRNTTWPKPPKKVGTLRIAKIITGQ